MVTQNNFGVFQVVEEHALCMNFYIHVFIEHHHQFSYAVFLNGARQRKRVTPSAISMKDIPRFYLGVQFETPGIKAYKRVASSIEIPNRMHCFKRLIKSVEICFWIWTCFRSHSTVLTEVAIFKVSHIIIIIWTDSKVWQYSTSYFLE